MCADGRLLSHVYMYIREQNNDMAGIEGGRKGGEGTARPCHSQAGQMAWKITLTQDGRGREIDGAKPQSEQRGEY